jgi:hypothetical protein
MSDVATIFALPPLTLTLSPQAGGERGQHRVFAVKFRIEALTSGEWLDQQNAVS